MKNLLKYTTIGAMLLFSSVAGAQVIEEKATSTRGIPLIRFINNAEYPASCYYSDSLVYLTFVVPPLGYSRWLPINQNYRWECYY